MAVVGGVLLVALAAIDQHGVALIAPAAFVRFWRLSGLEFWVAVVTATGGLVHGLLPAVLIGVLLTLLLVPVEPDRADRLYPTARAALRAFRAR